MSDAEHIARLEWILARLIGSLSRELGMDYATMLMNELHGISTQSKEARK